ncbi:MAG: hypothetical protein QW076_02905, partial [Candidatus Anstonellales archaeon]
MKGGSALGYGGLLAILLISSFTIIYITGGYEPVKRNIISIESRIISFGNNVNLLIKTFNVSIDFISQRAAYDLGKTGGIKGSEIAMWNDSYPTIEILKEQLENKIIENLPQGSTKNGRIINWGDASIVVSDYDTTCGPIENSKCFLVSGNKSFSIYDSSIDTRVSIAHKINHIIDSSYFKLLVIGRKILEEPKYNSLLSLNDFNGLENLLKSDYNAYGLDFKIRNFGTYIDVLIISNDCLSKNEYYCIAPLKPGENGIVDPVSGKQIPYDYLKLNFRIKGGVITECNNNADDDGDGLIDEDDPGCLIDALDQSSYNPNDNKEKLCENSCDILFYKLSYSWGGKCGDTKYDPIADIDKDKVIDMSDVGDV